MRDAQSLLDQVIVFAGKTLGESEVRAALGVADRSVLYRVTEAILGRDPARCLQAVDELHRYGYESVNSAATWCASSGISRWRPCSAIRRC